MPVELIVCYRLYSVCCSPFWIRLLVMGYCEDDVIVNDTVVNLVSMKSFVSLPVPRSWLSRREHESAYSFHGTLWSCFHFIAECDPELVCENEGYLDKECKCNCKDGFGGLKCADIRHDDPNPGTYQVFFLKRFYLEPFRQSVVRNQSHYRHCGSRDLSYWSYFAEL